MGFQSPDEDSFAPSTRARPHLSHAGAMFQSPDEDSFAPKALRETRLINKFHVSVP